MSHRKVSVVGLTAKLPTSRGSPTTSKNQNHGVIRTQNTRQQRTERPYQPASTPRRGDSNNDFTLKFLLPNHLTGTLIGNGGSAIKLLMEITRATIRVSSANDYYPGSRDRVIFIIGSEPSVTLTESLIWEMIGQQTQATNLGVTLLWDPLQARNHPGDFDDVVVENRITIPSATAGYIMGRGGSTIQYLGEEGGCELVANAKEESEVTHERILSLRGTVASCMKTTSLVISKLGEIPHGYSYVYPGTSYTRPNQRNQQPKENNNNSADDFDIDDIRQNGKVILLESGLFDPKVKFGGAETLRANTTIELAVPDSVIGTILGTQGAVLNEYIKLSGAKITVSRRGEFIEGTTNRLVTIVGTPPCAQMAHTLIIHKLKQETQNQHHV